MPSKPRRAAPKEEKVIRKVLKVLLIVLLVLLLLIGGAYLFLQIKLGEIGRIKAGEYTAEDFDVDTSAADTIDAVDWGEANVATSIDGVVNLLLVGQDTRDAEERARSDSMIVLSVNQNTNQLTMVSLMRDLYVQIPGYSDNKLNAAFQFGGFDLLDETIETNFGIDIDYNVEVDFSGFREIVDSIDGIYVYVNQEEADYFNERHPTWGLKEGICHLIGKQALAYARLRHVGNSDFERTERQRTIIQATYAKLKEESWPNLLKVYDVCAGYVSTDMTNNQILSIAFSAYSMGLDSINSYRIPAADTFTDETVRGMAILVPKDWNQTRKDLWDYLYDDPALHEEDNQAETELEKVASEHP